MISGCWGVRFSVSVLLGEQRSVGFVASGVGKKVAWRIE